MGKGVLKGLLPRLVARGRSRGRLEDRIQRKRRKIIRMALLLIIIGETAYVSAIFLPPLIAKMMLSSEGEVGGVEVEPRDIANGLLVTLVDPITGSFIDVDSLGVAGGPAILYITTGDANLIAAYCGALKALDRASRGGLKSIVVVMPNPMILDRPASRYTVEQAIEYLRSICGVDVLNPNLIIATARWGDYPNGIPGYGRLINDLLKTLNIEAAEVNLPIVIGVGVDLRVERGWVAYGGLVNATFIESLAGALAGGGP